MASNNDLAVDGSENLEDMVRRRPSYIPERYIRSEEDRSKDVDMSHLSHQIPVLDLMLLSNGNKEELHKLDKACQDWGFFQIINHGIAEEVQQSLKNAVARFFKLSLQEKLKYSFDPLAGQGYGRPYHVSEDQTLDWSDSLLLRLYPSHFRNTEFWPTTPPDFWDSIEAYTDGVVKVSERLLGSLSLILGMEREDALLRLHQEMCILMRMNLYPTCCKPDQVLGLSPHSDPCTITILMQEDAVTGLQVRHDGGWVPVNPISNALVVNIGDVIEMWSNGKYKSIEHRALPNESKERISFASFVMPHLDIEIEPLKHMLSTKDDPKKYHKIKYGDFLKHTVRKKQDGKDEHFQKYIL